MRVLHLAPERKNDTQLTAASFIDEELQALARAGVEIFVLSPAVDAAEDRNGIRLRSTSSLVGSPARLGAIWKTIPHLRHAPTLASIANPRYCLHVAAIEQAAASLIRREKIDLVHSHFGYPGGFGGLTACLATRTALVANLRGTDLAREPSLRYGERLSRFFNGSIQMLLSLATRTLYASNFMRSRGIALGAVPNRTRVIRKGVNLRLFSPHAVPQRRYQLNSEAPVLLAVAGLLPVKGVADLLSAAAMLREAHDFNLVICGNGPLRAELETQARHLDIGDRTLFLGKVPRAEMPGLFALADIVVLPSVLDAAPNVLLEAAAAGRPVVCTAAGGPQEYVVDGETGLVSRPQDPVSLAAKVQVLLEDADLRRRMGSAGRSHAEKNFDYDRMISELRSLYEEAVAAGPPRAEPPQPKARDASGRDDV